MVSLPPSVDELNDYGRFSFLNEMHTLAAWITAYCAENGDVSGKLQVAVEVIQEERTSMRDMFDCAYERPSDTKVVALILRCAELYLDYGLWYDLCHADIRLREKKTDGKMESLKTVFHDTDLTSRYAISSPIIELTLTRLEMMEFFSNRQDEGFTGAKPLQLDPLSNYKVMVVETPCDAQAMNNAEIPDDAILPEDLIVDDDDYLIERERYVWAVFGNFRVFGSLFCLAYYTVFFVMCILELTSKVVEHPLLASVASGFSLAMVLSEIVSLRLCLIACFKPKSNIPCIYPGIELYLVQVVACWIGSVLSLLMMFVEGVTTVALPMLFFCIHGVVALPLTFAFLPCFFVHHQRGERKFRWARIKFFDSCAWFFVRVIFCFLLTPGIYQMQMIFAYSLRNKPSVTTMAESKWVSA